MADKEVSINSGLADWGSVCYKLSGGCYLGCTPRLNIKITGTHRARKGAQERFMKSTIALFLIFVFITPLLAKDPAPAAAQTPSSASMTTTSLNTKETEVKDYKGFLEYNKKHAIVRANDLGEIQLDRNEARFPNKKIKIFKKFTERTKEEVGFLSTDKRRVAVFNRKDVSFKIFNNLGEKISDITLSQFPKRGLFAFSDTRIFAISPSFDGPGGFEIFTSTGRFIKWIDAGDIEGYAVSNTQKYFAVTTLENDFAYFKLFDLDGNVLWMQVVAQGGNTSVIFSYDDEYVIVKMPEYWIRRSKAPPYNSERKVNKLYIINIAAQRIVAEEDYVGQ